MRREVGVNVPVIARRSGGPGERVTMMGRGMQTLDGRSPATPGGRLVYVVEDEPGIRNALALTLERAGYAVEAYCDFDGVLGGLKRSRPFLVVLDVSLEKSDAIEVLQALSDCRFEGAVQLLSGNSSGLLEDIRLVGERRKLRMLPVLRKPCRMQAVRAIVDAEARARPSPQPAQAPPADPAPVRSSRQPVCLASALDEGRVEIWYQPKIDLLTGALVGAEALSRIRLPDGDVAFPGSFLPEASSSTMSRLTEFVLRRTLLDWTEFALSDSPIRMSVNVSTQLLSAFPLAALLRECVPGREDWPGLVLEITEEDALRDVERAHEAAIQLMIYGIVLSIDDFGLGYSSLARLRDIPFKELKLDRSFVDGCAADRTRGALCKAIVDLAHSLGAVVVAEGVELADDLAHLRAVGCDVAQGYLLWRPMPKADLLRRIASGSFRPRIAESPSSGSPSGVRPATLLPSWDAGLTWIPA